MVKINGYDIELTRGDTLALRVDLSGRDLPEGSDGVMTIKKHISSDEVILRKRFDAGDEKLDIVLAPAETDLEPGVYYWDLRLQIPCETGGYEVYTPMEYAVFVVLPVVGEDIGVDGDPGISPDLPVLQELIAQTRAVLDEADGVAAAVKADAQAAADTLQEMNGLAEAFEVRSAEVLESIPEDYTQLTDRVDQLSEAMRLKAPGIGDTAYGAAVYVEDAVDAPLHGLTVYGRTDLSAQPSVDAPALFFSAGSGGSVRVQACGRNLFDWKQIPGCAAGGVVFTNNQDGSFLVEGTAEGDSAVTAYCEAVLPEGTYTLSSGLAGVKAQLRAERGGVVSLFTGEAYVYGDETSLQLALCAETDAAVSGMARPQITAGSGAAPWEAYLDCGSAVIPVPGGLSGVPVTAGGNYTDENGGQWICDEIDLARGVYIRRVCTEEMDAGCIHSFITYGSQGYCHASLGLGSRAIVSGSQSRLSHFKTRYAWKEDDEYGYASETQANVFFSRWSTQESFEAWLTAQKEAGTPLTVQYVLETPVETALDEALLSALSGMRSNRSGTLVQNDASAGLAVGYYADTKQYIDKKIAAALGG